jgi:hypothetical protein
MANADFARGLVPVRNAHGGTYNCAARAYTARSDYATALFIGDPVVKSGLADANGRPGCILATAGATNAITGVVVGFEDAASLILGYGAASTQRTVLVADDPSLLFEIQEDSGGAATALADVGLNVDLISAAGSTTTRTSGWMADSSTKAVGATLQLKIVGFQERSDVTPASSKSKLLVKINLHTEVAGVVGL